MVFICTILGAMCILPAARCLSQFSWCSTPLLTGDFLLILVLPTFDKPLSSPSAPVCSFSSTCVTAERHTLKMYTGWKVLSFKLCYASLPIVYSTGIILIFYSPFFWSGLSFSANCGDEVSKMHFPSPKTQSLLKPGLISNNSVGNFSLPTRNCDISLDWPVSNNWGT